ncbi:MAG: (Fe-S)-binding protein [Oscillospiraceae bacterium]|nr:(Fe-S)-binding protein [Oscillospiraceae bacterium]
MVSQKALQHAEKCRFCWMCRHLCPVQHQTGKELNTPRAKGLLLSMLSKGTAEFDKDMAKAMYECMLCDACVNDCCTGYQPPLFIREARTEAVVNDLAPAAVMQCIENIENSGNIYGAEKPSFGQDGTDVLVYIGEVAACKVPEMAKAYLRLLKKAGVSAKVLDCEPASGMMLADLMGYVQEVTDQAKSCADAINATGLPTVVVLDSYDAEIMKQHYAEWGCEIKAEVVTATAYVAKLLEDGKLTPKAEAKGAGACHDDDRLARSFHEFAPVRDIAKAAGYTLTEMFNKERLAKSCGTAVALSYMPGITTKVASGRWADLCRTEAKAMLTANPQAYLCLSQCVPEGMTLVDLYTALNEVV